MDTLHIWWKPFCGYFAAADNHAVPFHLDPAYIIFYNEQGETVEVSLDYGCSLGINLKDVPFKVRKKVCYTNNEVFVVTHKRKNKYDEKNNATLYVPMSLCDLQIGKPFEVTEGTIIYTLRNVFFDIEYYNTYCGQPHPKVQVMNEESRLIVETHVSSRHTDEYEKTLKLTEDMNKTCGVMIDAYTLNKVLQHYKLIKKRKK